MADDDVVDEVQGVTTMAVTSAARSAETLLRASQDRSLRQAHEQRQSSEEAQRRYQAQVGVAEQFYRRAAEPEFVRVQHQDVVANAWRGAQEWKDLEPVRFGPYAERLTQNIDAEYGIDLDDIAARLGDRDLAAELGEMRVQRTRGVDEDLDTERTDERDAEPGVALGLEYDSDSAREARSEQLEHADLPPEVRNAVKTADHLNGVDPAGASQTRAGRRGRPVKRRKIRTRNHEFGR